MTKKKLFVGTDMKIRMKSVMMVIRLMETDVMQSATKSIAEMV